MSNHAVVFFCSVWITTETPALRVRFQRRICRHTPDVGLGTMEHFVVGCWLLDGRCEHDTMR